MATTEDGRPQDHPEFDSTQALVEQLRETEAMLARLVGAEIPPDTPTSTPG